MWEGQYTTNPITPPRPPRCKRARPADVEIYITIAGPRVGLTIRDGSYFSADALLAVKFHYSQPGMPDWNTIHVLGGFPGVDPAARKASSDAATRQISPESGS